MRATTHGAHGNAVETRLYNCRNVMTSKLVSGFFNGLNYHSAHHAFPRIPYYFLAEAHARLAALAAAKGQPLPAGRGYARTLVAVARTPMLLTESGAIPARDFAAPGVEGRAA